MIALLWVVLAWSVTLGLFHRGVMAELFRRGGPRVERAQLALVLVLLGSFSGAAAGSAEEVLANPLASERAIRGLLVGLALLILLPVVVDRLRDAGDLRRPALASLAIYVFVCGVSTLYSSAPLVTAAKAAELAVALTVVWALVTSPDAQRESRAPIELLIHLLAALVILAMAGFFVFERAFSEIGNRPGFVFRQTMTSPYLHSNGLSAAAALAATYALGRYLSSSQPGHTRPTDRRWRWLILSILSVGGVVLSSGRQGLAMVLLAMAVLLWMWRRSYFLLLFLPGLATIVWAFWEAVSAAVLRGQPIGLFTALSGRLTWWSSAITAWAEHPWTGFGFGVGGRFVALERIGFGEVSSVHNGYLEALVGVGLIGVVPLVIATLFAVAYSVRQLRRDPAEGGLIVPLLLHTMVSLGFGGWLGPQWLLFALLVGRADLARLKNAGLPGPQAPRMDQLQVSSFRNVGQ